MDVAIEDCLKNAENRFALVHIASKRVKQIDRENKATKIRIESRGKDIVIALEEIALGKTREKIE